MNAIHWVIPDLVFKGREKSAEALRDVTVASMRMRAFPAITAMEEKGFNVTLGERVAGQPSHIFVGKIGGPDVVSQIPMYLDQLRQHKANGAKVYLDYTDNHIGTVKFVAPFYEEAIKFTDVAIVPSLHMAGLLRASYGGEIAVIEDALDISVQPIKDQPQKARALLWFGHETNIRYLMNFVRTGFKAGDSAKLVILSSAKGLEMFKAAPLQSNATLEVLLYRWSPAQMLEAAKVCDACIIPSDTEDRYKSGVSANRLITALALGLPTAADNLESYKEFSEFYIDIRSEKFRAMMKDPRAFNPAVRKAQQEIVPRFSLENIKKAWSSLV